MTGVIIERAETLELLRSSLATIESAVALVPAALTHTNPEAWPEDSWTVAMNVAHMTVYEEAIATPVLAALAAGGDGVGVTRSDSETWFLPEAQALAEAPMKAILARFRHTRQNAIDTVDTFDEERWNVGVTPLWTRNGPGMLRSPAWVATKTFQHTWEHGNAVLRMALFGPR